MRRRKKKIYPKPKRRRRGKSILKKKSFWIVLLFLTASGGIFYLMFFHSFFQIKLVEISGVENMPKESVSRAIDDLIIKKIFSFETKSIFLVNANEIARKISENHLVAKVSLKRKFPEVLAINIEERKQIGAVCDLKNCFHFDRLGVVFEKSDNEDNGIFVKFEKPKNLILGKEAIDKNLVEGFLTIQGVLQRNFKLSGKEFNIAESYEKITIMTSEGWKIYYELPGDAADLAENLTSVLKQIPQEKRQKLDYIDLRFGNKVFLKYKDSKTFNFLLPLNKFSMK